MDIAGIIHISIGPSGTIADDEDSQHSTVHVQSSRVESSHELLWEAMTRLPLGDCCSASYHHMLLDQVVGSLGRGERGYCLPLWVVAPPRRRIGR